MSEPPRSEKKLLQEISALKKRNQELERSEAAHLKVEDELRRSLERLKLLIDGGPDFFFLKDQELRYQLVNAANAKFFGRDEADILGRTDNDLMPEEAALGCRESDGVAIGEKRLVVTVEKVGDRSYETYKFPVMNAGEIAGVAGVVRDVTGRERAEQSLKDVQARYRFLFEHAPDGMVVVDPASARIVEFNEAAHKQLGYSREEFAGLGIPDIEVMESPEETLRHIEKIIREGRDDFETLHRTRQGEVRNVHVTAQATELDGHLVYHCVWRDITERKRAEAALRESKEQYRELVENANSIILRMDPTGVITFFNEFSQQFFGYPEGEILGRNVLGTIVPPVDSAGSDLRAFVQDLGRNPDRYHTNVNENMRRSGERVWIAWTNKPVYDEQGRVTHILCIGNDITAERKAAEELHEREEIQKAIISSSPIPTFFIDRNHKVVYWNKALEELTGVSGEKVIGTDDHPSLFYGEERPCLADLVVDDRTKEISRWYPDKAARSDLIEGAYEATDLVMIPGKEERWLRATAARITDSKGAVIGAIETLEDITERTLALKTLKRREHDLEVKSVSLEEAYTALKVLLQHKEEDKEAMENSVIANVTELVFPYLDKLENSRPTDVQTVYLNIVRSNLNDIISPFLQKMSAIHTQLTPMEFQVTGLIKAGKSSKEIATILHIGTGTVETHRKSIRSKLGLNNRKTNLQSYLRSLTGPERTGRK